MKTATELLINGFLVSNHNSDANYYEHKFSIYKSILIKPIEQFEFIINNKLELVHVTNLYSDTKYNYAELYNQLFEINQVRVNPIDDNTEIIKMFTETLSNLGVKLHNKPKNSHVEIGTLKDTVRFYVKENNTVIFLASNYKPKLVYSRKF